MVAGEQNTGEDPPEEVDETFATAGTQTSLFASPIGDLPGAIIPESYLRLKEVYGDHPHANDGTHLDGGIADDQVWQGYLRRLIPLPTRRYHLPGNQVGKRFLRRLVVELEGVLDRKWNSEKFLIFQIVILQKTKDVKGNAAIGRRISRRLDQWERGEFGSLVRTTENTAFASISTIRGKDDDVQIANVYTKLVLEGKLRAAVRYVTDREGGGLLQPTDTDEKSGEPIVDVLRSKHPEEQVPEAADLHVYDEVPDFVDLDITADVVEKVAKKLSGSAGPGGVDSSSLQSWLLNYGVESRQLRKACARLAEWLANTHPPWAAYRALINGRLVAIDKCPGVRPVGIGELFRRLVAKCVLLVAGEEAQIACGVDQLCGGLEAGIEGGIHAMSSIWDAHSFEEQWGFLLVDARNAFNEGNRGHMLWNVRHEWPSGSRFTFNCYRHYAVMIVRCADGTAVFVVSREGVTQGDPLAMIAYAILMLPLVRRLKAEVPDCHQPWYADDAAAGASFPSIRVFWDKLCELGPAFGYFPEPTKSILVVREQNFAAAVAYFADLKFQVVRGKRHLGGFIGEREARDAWIGEKVDGWVTGVQRMAEVAVSRPQAVHIGVVKSLSQEWLFIQRVIGDLDGKFDRLEEALATKLLPALFGETEVDNPRRRFCALPTKSGGIALPDPTKAAEKHHRASETCTGHIVGALLGRHPFRQAEHRLTLEGGKAEYMSRKLEEHDAEFEMLVRQRGVDEQKTLRRAPKTGAWLSISPTIVNGCGLGKVEWRDALNMRYARTPADFPKVCDGCGCKFSLAHALKCQVGGLIHRRHNEVNADVQHHAVKATNKSSVRDEPSIHLGRDGGDVVPTAASEPDTQDDDNVPAKPGERGDGLIRGLWEPGTDAIYDVRITDCDALSYRGQSSEAVLANQRKAKKRKYLQSCLEQRRHFTPFVASTDGLLDREASALLKRLALKLSDKWQRPYSVVAGYLNARMSVSIVRATHSCLRGSRVPSSRMSKFLPQFEDGAGLGLVNL